MENGLAPDYSGERTDWCSEVIETGDVAGASFVIGKNMRGELVACVSEGAARHGVMGTSIPVAKMMLREWVLSYREKRAAA